MSIPSNIPVVEDEPTIVELITMNLQHTRHYPIRAYNAEQTLSLMSDALPDLILLGWMLPGKSRVIFAKELCANECMHQTPTIMLTARNGEQNEIIDLDGGADGCVTKPSSPKELLARIRAVLRCRAPQLTDDVVAINGLKLDPATHHMMATSVEAENPIKLDLGPTEFRLLHFLMTHPERVHSRSQLLDQMWGDRMFVEERTADVHIERLRAALAPGGYDNMVEAMRGSGCRLTRSPGQ